MAEKYVILNAINRREKKIMDRRNRIIINGNGEKIDKDEYVREKLQLFSDIMYADKPYSMLEAFRKLDELEKECGTEYCWVFSKIHTMLEDFYHTKHVYNKPATKDDAGATK